MAVKLIVGLQNPGEAYAATRHNVGAWLVQALAEKHQTVFKLQSSLKASLAGVVVESVQARLALPSTFMNHSGSAVRAVVQFYRIEPAEVLIVHDDLDLPAGRIQLKLGGGHGGHNGLRDIIAHLGTAAFYRLRIGIGHPGLSAQVVDHVLSKPSVADRTLIFDAIDRGLTVIPLILAGDFSRAMTQINGSC